MANGEYSLHIDHQSGDSLLQIEGDWRGLKAQLEAIVPLKRGFQQTAPATKYRPEAIYTCYTWSKPLTKAETSQILLGMWFSDALSNGKISVIMSPTLAENGAADEIQFHDVLTVEILYKKTYGQNYWIDLPGSALWTQDLLMEQIYKDLSRHKVFYTGEIFASSWAYRGFTAWADDKKPPWWRIVNAARLAEEARIAKEAEERRRKEEEARRAEEARKAAEEEAKRQARAKQVMLNKPYNILGLSPTARDWQVEIVWKAMMLAVHPDKNNGADKVLLNEMTAMFNYAHDKIKKDRGAEWNPKKPWIKENRNE